jgi:hypothetical protein
LAAALLAAASALAVPAHGQQPNPPCSSILDYLLRPECSGSSTQPSPGGGNATPGTDLALSVKPRSAVQGRRVRFEFHATWLVGGARQDTRDAVVSFGGGQARTGETGRAVLSVFLTRPGRMVATATIESLQATTPVRVAARAGVARSGSRGPNRLIGTPFDDRLFGNGGNDRILGRGGDDRLVGGAGNDLIEGGAGADSINGSDGDDREFGGDGDDRITETGSGDDRLYGGPGNDLLKAGRGRDVVYGGPGDDVIYGGAGVDTILCGPGSDTVHLDRESERRRLQGCESVQMASG